MDDKRNLIIFALIAALVLFGGQFVTDYFFPTANPPATKMVDGKSVPVPSPTASTPAADAPDAIRPVAAALGASPRLPVRTPKLQGSIALKGARIDDLLLTNYRETIAKNAPPIRLLAPAGTKDARLAGFGWAGEGVATPGPDTVWTADAAELVPGKPVTLSWNNGRGLVFAMRIAVDENYMFTVRQSVANRSGSAVAVQPYGYVSQRGVSKDPDSWTIHTGPTGVFNGAANYDVDFSDVDAAGNNGLDFATTGGWLGFNDKYWLTALVPDQGKPVNAKFRIGGGGAYQADFRAAQAVVQPGRALTTETRFFAGAKEVGVLQAYENDLKIVQFDKAIDWGWFAPIERPIFWVLDWLFKFTGNFGVAIILLTVLVRGLMFPIAQRQFASMAGMRAVQPKMKALQERHKDDKPKLQEEMMKLYREEKVNPIAGCLPLVLQIPIFYALYKVLMLTIEMRHQPFILWIKDLSAPDPATLLNLFGYLNFTPPHFLAIGVLPVLLGITMYLQFKLNPQPMDEMQKQVFSLMPWVFMFVMAPFAAGLQLYWTVSNLLTIAQQKWLYSRHPALKEAAAK
ncbi:membrane protein insertase YidC [Sphingomonas sanxanigenens]|uniref:Membrane protein insertase YidC n=1 Tax=Sphingomonas sanxanigenens DSM 19645 = NX02 TaxID=1123269 RepID=W0A7T0_9SPHN|nr:membrane protein insertase YidC [Sphingomonas sanxanigenens]AHE53161.1 hypothetical protein NX02_07170 [Sphingomonas sanxanigenens DSM 19645 = NX02]